MKCPEGYYERNGKCVKSITIKRKGIYGKGFLSEPQSEQYSKIRKEERKENPNTVEKQMAALNAFNHGEGSAHKDLQYAEKIGKEKRMNKGSEHGCPEGYEWVSAHYKRQTGTSHKKFVKGHCRRVR